MKLGQINPFRNGWLALALVLLVSNGFSAVDYEKIAKEHWSFQPLADPSLPKVPQNKWVKTDLDRFIRSAQAERNLSPNGEADRRTLVRGGFQFGETDEIGFKPATDSVSVQDVHATILHLMGLNHERLPFSHQGRDFRLTDVSGNVIDSIIA